MWIEKFKNKNNETNTDTTRSINNHTQIKTEARKCCVEQEYKTISKRSNVSFRRKNKRKTEQQVVKRIKNFELSRAIR